MKEAVKEIHKEGFIVIRTAIGEITIALPDSVKDPARFSMSVDHENGIANKVILEFDE